MKLILLISGIIGLAPIVSHGGEGPAVMENREQVQHKEHQALRDNVKHRGIVVLDKVYKTTPVVRHHMALFLEFYEKLNSALVDSDIEAADEAAETMRNAVNSVPVEDLRDSGKDAWHQHATLYNKTLKELQHEAVLEAKRSYFAHISEIVYCTVKSFGLGEKLSNVYYCPMALEGNGAYWLSESEKVTNPYFGKQMLDCGKLEEILGP